MLLLALVTLTASVLGWLGLWVVAPMLLGWSPTVIVSGSMLPGLRPGDVLEVDPAPRRLHAGAIITFRSADQPHRVLTHRLLRRNADGSWQTKGDANAVADPHPVTAAQVLGRPRLLIPYAGLGTFWRATGQFGKLTAAAGAALLLLLWVLRRPAPVAAPSRGWAGPATGHGAAPSPGHRAPVRSALTTGRRRHAGPTHARPRPPRPAAGRRDRVEAVRP